MKISGFFFKYCSVFLWQVLMFPDGRSYSVLRFYRPSAHIVFPCISMEKIQSAQRKLAPLKLGVFVFFLTVSFNNFFGGLGSFDRER